MVVVLNKRWLIGLALVLIALIATVAVGNRDSSTSTPAPAVVAASRGGTVRVGVLSPPEIADSGDGGANLKALVGAQLFVAQPDGSWRASLVKPGSDVTAKDGRSATFAFRDNAKWSDGTAITVDDLRRTADNKLVQDIQQSGDVIEVRFSQRLEDWRKLWSGSAAILATDAKVSGGPYVIDSVMSGLQTDLIPNPHWYGREGGPFLDHLVLVVASDGVMGRQLLSTKQIDVFSPPVESARTAQLRTLSNVSVSTDSRGGSWTALMFNSRLDVSTRQRLAVSVPRGPFVNSLLVNEAQLADGINAADGPWKDGAVSTEAKASDSSASVSMFVATTLISELQRTLKTAFEGVGVNPTFGSPADSADVVLKNFQEGPNECWSCDFGTVDSDLAAEADAGDVDSQRALTKKLRDEALVLPLWKESAVVAYADSVSGIQANGFSSTTTWNAVVWHR